MGIRFTCTDDLARDSFVLPSAAVLRARLPKFHDLAEYLEMPAPRELETYRNPGTTEDGRAIVDCNRADRLLLAVEYTDGVSFGRYAFKTRVQNPADTPMPNIWMLQSYSENTLVEEGICGGYEIVRSYAATPGQVSLDGLVVSSANQRRIWALGLSLLVALFRGLPILH